MTAAQAINRAVVVAREIVDAENYEHTTESLRLTAWLTLKNARRNSEPPCDTEPKGAA